MFGFLNIFKKKEVKTLENGLNKDVVEGFIDKIEDIVCIANENYQIDYINKKEMNEKYKYLFELLCYEENKETYNLIMNKITEEGFYANNIKLIKNKEESSMYIAIYHIQTVNKYIVYIKDTDKYFKNENMLKEQLNQSNEELKNKELFVANLSHEIKTPINIIVAMIYFLKSTKLDENQIEYINRLESASELLTKLVNNILNVTKSDKVTNSTNTKEVFILQNIIDKVYQMFKDDLEEKNISWSVETNANLEIEVYEDKTKLEQVFINLVSNAIKYTDKGYIELQANKVKEDSNSYYMKFCIKDTGRGIKKEDTIKIFKEFEQNSDPTTKEVEGFGLGLPLVRKIIESMGGKIWVESSYGLGTKFFFELKLDKKGKENKEKLEQKQNYNQSNQTNQVNNNIQNLTNKILIVDDNKIITEITKKVLKEIDLECDIATDGMQAIKMLEEKGKNNYALILMDIHMPKYNGYDISRIMKQDLKVTTPIVALTATNITENVIEENKEYIYSYIQKPVKPEELKSIVKKILNKTSWAKPERTTRETILFIADQIKNWEILQNLNNDFNVICTLNQKDIDIIMQTKKIAALIIDQKEKSIYEQYFNIPKETLKLILEYDLIENQQENIKITNIEGFTKKIEDIDEFSYILLDMINRKRKETTVDNQIEGYNEEISDVYKFLYDSLVNLTSVRSKETGSHLVRTQEYIKVMLEEYEKTFQTGDFESHKKIEDIGVAATLHDIGKVGIPDSVLNKPGKLTPEEYDRIKEHTVIGNQILENTNSDKLSNDVLEYAKEITLHHHEKYDGTGYPDKLKGDEISTVSKIMAIIDVYDALVNKRIYKDAMPYEEAEEYIVSQSEKAFDPKAVNVFMKVKEKLRKINEKYKE